MLSQGILREEPQNECFCGLYIDEIEIYKWKKFKTSKESLMFMSNYLTDIGFNDWI